MTYTSDLCGVLVCKQTEAVSDGRVNAASTRRGRAGHSRRHVLAPTCGTTQHSGPYLV